MYTTFIYIIFERGISFLIIFKITYEIFALLPIMQRTLIMQITRSLNKEGWEWGRLVNHFLLVNYRRNKEGGV